MKLRATVCVPKRLGQRALAAVAVSAYLTHLLCTVSGPENKIITQLQINCQIVKHVMSCNVGNVSNSTVASHRRDCSILYIAPRHLLY